MNKIRNILCLFIVFLTGTSLRLYSQLPCNKGDNCGEITFEKKLTGRAYINKYPGNQMQFSGDWQNGALYLTNGTVIQHINLRYNRFLDEVIWRRIPGQETAILTKEQIDKFILEDDSHHETARFVKTNLAQWQPKGKEETYLEELVSGKVTLYVYRRLLMQGRDYSMYPSYMYFVKTDGQLYRIYLNRISIKTLFRQDKSTIKKAIRSAISLRIKENDLVKIIGKYNELLAGKGSDV